MKKLLFVMVVLAAMGIFSACAAPTPEVIEKEVVVTKEVPVEKVVEVEKEGPVEIAVIVKTATPASGRTCRREPSMLQKSLRQILRSFRSPSSAPSLRAT